MATVTLTATFPAVREFRDYHDIWEYGLDLNKLFKSPKAIRNAEVGFDAGGCYWGVYYVGRKPAKAVIDKLLDDAGFIPDLDDGGEFYVIDEN